MVQFVPGSVNTLNIFDGPSEIYVNGVFLGATVGGVELELATEYGEKIADQSPLLLGSYIKSQRGKLRFELEELSYQNLQYIFASASIGGGGTKSTIPTFEIRLVGNGPNQSTRTFTIFKGRFHGNTTGKFMLGETVSFSCEIFMEADQGRINGQQYFNVVDV